MIQFNLLPDVKLDYIKAQRTRRLVFSASFIVSAAAIALLVLMLSIDGLQKKHLHDLSADITSESQTLRKKPNINTILTVQNQLESLTALHDTKPASARLFTYLNQLTPANVSVSSLNIDFAQDTIIIGGNADALSSVNQFVDTLKLTTYTATSNDANHTVTKGNAFSSVVLTGFGLNNASKDKSQAANYTVTLTYDKAIFDITKQVSLSVPSITTRAQLQSPADLFKAGGN